MKKHIMPFIFASLFSIVPVGLPVQASGQVKIGDAYLTSDKPYFQNGFAVEYCDLGRAGCMARLETVNDTVINLYLKNYDNDGILIEGFSEANIYAEDGITIRTSGEYGIKTDAEMLRFSKEGPYGAFMSIIVNSSTDHANGIINTRGSIDLGGANIYNISVASGVDHDTITTDNVTGLTTPADKAIYSGLSNSLSIWNPSGNYSVYTGKFTVSLDGGHNFLGEITYKVTDGYGSPFLNYDYEEAVDNPLCDIPHAPYTTGIRESYDGREGFLRFTSPLTQFTADYDDTLTAGEDYYAASERILNSLSLGQDDWNPYDLNKWSSELVIADDFESGTYHSVDTMEHPTIEAGEKYALKISYQPWGMDMVVFTNNPNDQNIVTLNGEEYPYVKAISYLEAYALAPLNLDGIKTDKAHAEDTTSLLTMDSGNTISGYATNNKGFVFPRIDLPKAPNTGIPSK